MPALLLAAGFWLGGAFAARAQDAPQPERRNALYAELGGCGFATLNYERLLAGNASLRLASGVIPLIGPDVLVLPSVIFGDQRHRLSVGVGLLAARTETGSAFEATGEVAYRFQAKSGFFSRAAVGLMTGSARWGVLPLPGVSVGKSF